MSPNSSLRANLQLKVVLIDDLLAGAQRLCILAGADNVNSGFC
jgi:hypothetical protein